MIPSFIVTFRETLEAALIVGIVLSYLARTKQTRHNSLVGARGGIMAAILLGYAVFVGSIRISIKKFFNITSILLILFAAGLVAYGVHELQEAGVAPTVIEHVWNINPAANPDGSYPLLREEGHVGSILKGLFGYNGDPSLLEVLSYLGYLLLVVVLWRSTERSVRAVGVAGA